ncbi:hypothetical protein BIV57_08860 [Mangrovactinospora gilvigrisea]|uniref:DUF2637 domain-containing protein n=1 Tax=Mangrovactinospora gilvigrisea TaxID=1428644 RepID=A0A1J7BH12_9ACTN|nr:DUF2637 domain-containing protein [Mangrovactinospora gilvigrisea]OIV37861.1 hypothetical protein BIV57_08860 [Mangrovactinospora gilvigrisea]
MTRIKGKALLTLALATVVAMAFRVSWNALRDVARATGADPTAALLYPFVVDGLMALALVATLVLTGDDRRSARRVLGTYTTASLGLNYVHGLTPALHTHVVDWGRLASWGPANWTLVLLATSLPVGSIYFGSDLVAKVLHHRPAPASAAPVEPAPVPDRSAPDLGAPTTAALPQEPAPLDSPEPSADAEDAPEPTPLRAVAAQSAPVRRATGRVPAAARSTRPTRTPDELLDEARTATAGWADDALTAEGIRRAVHTSAAKARTLRDTLRAERTDDASKDEAA